MKPPIPCKDCILMAVCNAKMYSHEDCDGMNAFDLRNKCDILSKYLEKYYSKVIDKTTTRTSLVPVHKFFMTTGYRNLFYLRDNIEKNNDDNRM